MRGRASEATLSMTGTAVRSDDMNVQDQHTAKPLEEEEREVCAKLPDDQLAALIRASHR
jgi:hypothetical protein